MVAVYLNKDNDLNRALRIFERKCRQAHIYHDFMQKSYYISRSEKKHRRKNRKNS